MLCGRRRKRKWLHFTLVRCFCRSSTREREISYKFIREVRRMTEEASRWKSRTVLPKPKFQRFRESVYRAYFHDDEKSPFGIFRRGASQYHVVTPTSVPFLISPFGILDPFSFPLRVRQFLFRGYRECASNNFDKTSVRLFGVQFWRNLFSIASNSKNCQSINVFRKEKFMKIHK